MLMYTVPECDECHEVIDWLTSQGKYVDHVELKKINDEWMEPTESGFQKINPEVKAFPALKIGKENPSFLIGTEGIKGYITKGFLHDIKTCPFLNKFCIERDCEKFVILKTGNVWEGGCSDYMNTKLFTQIAAKLSQLNQRG